jgi:hypothetical protein
VELETRYQDRPLIPHPGVVDEHRRLAECCKGCFDHTPPGLCIADVMMNKACSGTDLRGDGPARAIVQISEHDPSAFRGKEFRFGRALTACVNSRGRRLRAMP